MKHFALLTALGLATAAAATLAIAANPASGHSFLDRLHAADKNGDGMISRDEAAAMPWLAKHFDAIDANHDGQITPDELKAFHRVHARSRMAEHWKRIDTNGDGRISREEAQANAPRLAAHFDQVDANGDGFITPEELRAARARRRASQ